MANDYYTSTDPATRQTTGRSAKINSEFTRVEQAFDLLPTKAILDTGRVTYAADSGVADAYVVTLHKTPAAYYDGMHVRMNAGNTNTGACTVNVDGLGVKSIKLADQTDPAAGDLTAGDIVEMVYDSANGYFRILSPVRSIIAGSAAMTDAEIKTAYENNADTNEFSDAEQTTLGNITATGAVDLDTVKTKYDYLTITGAVDLDTISTKAGYITVTGAIDLDQIGSLTLTSSGAITAGDPVAINSDSTVSTISLATQMTKNITNVTVEPQEDQVPGHKVCVEIEPGKVLTVTPDEGDANDKGVAFITTFDPDDLSATLTDHAAVEIESGTTYNTNACLISPNKVLAVYYDADNTNQATAVVIQVIGTDMVVGTPVVFDTGSHTSSGNTVDCCKIGTDKAVVFSATGKKVYVCTVTGLTPAFGTGVTVDATSSTAGALASLDEDLFLLNYRAGADSTYHNGVVGTVDDTTITLGTAVRLYAETPALLNCGLIKKEVDGYKCFAWRSTAANNFHFLTIDGDAITVDATVSVAGFSNGWVRPIDDSEGSDETVFLGAFRAGGIFDASWYSYDVDLSAQTVTYRDVDSIVGTSSTKFHGCWIRNSDGVAENKFHLYYDEFNSGDVVLIDAGVSTRKKFIGFAADTVGDAASVGVRVAGGKDDNQTGLTAQTEYWLDWDGTLIAEETDVYAGIALSATEILIKRRANAA